MFHTSTFEIENSWNEAFLCMKLFNPIVLHPRSIESMKHPVLGRSFYKLGFLIKLEQILCLLCQLSNSLLYSVLSPTTVISCMFTGSVSHSFQQWMLARCQWGHVSNVSPKGSLLPQPCLHWSHTTGLYRGLTSWKADEIEHGFNSHLFKRPQVQQLWS